MKKSLAAVAACMVLFGACLVWAGCASGGGRAKGGYSSK